MFSRVPSRTRRTAIVLTMVSVSVLLPGCSGSSSGLSGRYEADMGEGKFRIDFEGGNKAKVAMVAPDGEELAHNCVYTIAGDKVTFTTDEPMGVPMTLTIDGDTLTDGSAVYRKK